MIALSDLEYLRRYYTEPTGDKGNRENSGVRGGRDHIFIQPTATLGTFFIPGLDSRDSYQIKCFNGGKWGNDENQCLEPTRDETPNKNKGKKEQNGRSLAQGSSGGAVRNNWLILDSCSTIRCSKNNSIVSNVTVIPS